jgi:hypothetical protein
VALHHDRLFEAHLAASLVSSPAPVFQEVFPTRLSFGCIFKHAWSQTMVPAQLGDSGRIVLVLHR